MDFFAKNTLRNGFICILHFESLNYLFWKIIRGFFFSPLFLGKFQEVGQLQEIRDRSECGDIISAHKEFWEPFTPLSSVPEISKIVWRSVIKEEHGKPVTHFSYTACHHSHKETLEFLSLLHHSRNMYLCVLAIYCWEWGPPRSVDNVPDEILLEKPNFYFPIRCQMEVASSLMMGASIHFPLTLSSGTLSDFVLIDLTIFKYHLYFAGKFWFLILWFNWFICICFLCCFMF